MTLSEAKALAQARAVKIADVVSIRRLKRRTFEIRDGHVPFDKQLVILVHSGWVTDGMYRRWGWPEPREGM